MNIDLVPAPAFEKSLVPAYQTNFGRIRDAFLRVSNRTYVESWQSTGGWPKSIAVDHPFKADVLVTMNASCWSIAGAMSGLAIYLDGVVQNNWAIMYFNEASSHKYVGSSVVVRGVSSGSHSWTINYAPIGNTTSDGNDYGSLGFTMIENAS